MNYVILEPYRGMGSRYACPGCGHKKTFTRYIDVNTGKHIADTVGRCDREVNCGYHLTPKQYFKAGGIQAVTMPVRAKRRPPSFIPPALYERSFLRYDENNFVQFLTGRFGREAAIALVNKYHIGTSKLWQGATVFWQLDRECRIRTGKIMLYDVATGRRVKEPRNHVAWAHTTLRLPGYELRQCLFGEHLLAHHPGHIAITESEKTAIIASVYLPQFTWLACGSLNGLSAAKCGVLRGHRVTLFPDLGCYAKWKAKAKELEHIAPMSVSRLLEEKATPQERSQGLDLADYLLHTGTA